MYAPSRATLLALDHFMSNCVVKEAYLNSELEVINYSVALKNREDRLLTGLCSTQDIVLEFAGSRGSALLKNFMVLTHLEEDKDWKAESLKDTWHLYEVIARLDFERRFTESLNATDLNEESGKEILTYTIDQHRLKVQMEIDSNKKISNDLLVTSYLLRRGYSIEEIPGDCVYVYTPMGSKRTVDEFGCDCIDFTMNMSKRVVERCAHLIAAEFYLRHRQAFIRGSKDFYASQLVSTKG